MARRALTDNDVAGVLAFIAGVLFLIVGWTGARGVDHFFDLLVELFGPNPVFRVLAYVLISAASLGGVAVLAGAFLMYYDRVRTGRILVLLGAGAGIVSLILFLVLFVRSPARIAAHEGVLPVFVGVGLSIAARLKSKPKPILK